MTYKFNRKSTKNLNTCHTELVLLFLRVIEEIDCSIVCGYRGYGEQEKAFNAGTSPLHYPKSNHNKTPSKAVDVLPYPFNGWDDLEQFEPLAEVIQRKAKELGIKIKWGKYFKGLVDMPHWEIS